MFRVRKLSAVRRILQTTLLAAALLPAAQAHVAIRPFEDDRPLTIAVIAFAIASDNSAIADAMHRALEPHFPKGIKMIFLPFEDFDRIVKNGEADVVLGTSGHIRRYPDLLHPIVTVVKRPATNPNRNDGATIIVRADRKELNTLEDLRGLRLVANNPLGFTGYQIPLGEIARITDEPEKFFASTEFTGDSRSTDQIAQTVIDGRADVGFLRLCALEQFLRRHPDQHGTLRVIEPRRAPDIACTYTTDLYPGFTLAVTKSISPEVSRRMTVALFSMPPTPHGSLWSIPTNFTNVDRLLKTLKIGPYAYLREWTLSRILQHFLPWILLGLFGLTGLMFHSWRAHVLVTRRTKQVRELMAQSIAQNEKLAAMQRAGAVTQLSSLFAHEMRQPLTAVSMYAEGLVRQFRKGTADPARLIGIAEKIVEETHRASDIVENVRAYAKGKTTPRTPIDLQHLMDEALRLWRSSPGREIPCTVNYPLRRVTVNGNELELVLVLVNLLKNAREAIGQKPHPLILFEAEVSGEDAVLRVSDSGDPLPPELVSRLGMPADSQKRQGLGLGLSIAAAIVESHGGTITFASGQNARLTGLTVTVTLPTAAPQPRNETSQS